jgi:hypothetical protein
VREDRESPFVMLFSAHAALQYGLDKHSAQRSFDPRSFGRRVLRFHGCGECLLLGALLLRDAAAGAGARRRERVKGRLLSMRVDIVLGEMF